MTITTRTNSYKILLNYFIDLYNRTTNPDFPIRRIGIGFNNVLDEYYESFDLFTDYEELEKERNLQRAIVEIKQKYGKNSVLKGMNFMDKATTRKRNTLVGGHNAE